MRYFAIHLLTLILLVSVGCGPSSDRIRIADPPAPAYEPSTAELECLDFSPSTHPDDLMKAVAPISLRGSAFGKVVAAVADQDFFLRTALSGSGNRYHTLFLPSNESWRQFLNQYPEVLNSAEQQIRLVREHLVLDKITYRNIAEGRPRSSNLNSRSVHFGKGTSGCFFLDGSVGLLLVDDVCNDGVIHVIDNVLIPEGF